MHKPTLYALNMFYIKCFSSLFFLFVADIVAAGFLWNTLPSPPTTLLEQNNNDDMSLISGLHAACLAEHSTEIVMEMCHGKRKCTIKADVATFGKPCRPDSRKYLKVVYTCGK